jgi:hypothetical protein
MNAQTIIAAAAFATIATAALTSTEVDARTTSSTPMVDSFATVDLSGSYIDLEPIGVVQTDSAGQTSLKPIGYWATGTDGSVELKPIGQEYQDSYDFEWTVEPADVSSSFRELGEDLMGLEPIGIIELDADGLVGLKPIGIEQTDRGGYVDLEPIGLDYQDGDTVSLKPIGSDPGDMIGLKPIGIVQTDLDGYIDLDTMGELDLQSNGNVELDASITCTICESSSRSTYLAEQLLSSGR